MAKKYQFIRLDQRQREELNGFINEMVAKQRGSSIRRAHAIVLSDAGKTPSEIALILGTSEASVYRWFLGYRKFGPAGLVGRIQPGKLTPKQIDKLLKISGRQPGQEHFVLNALSVKQKVYKKPWSYRKMTCWVKANWNINISPVNLRLNILKRMLMDK